MIRTKLTSFTWIFDKANRYGPAGEQLTHLLLDDTLGTNFEYLKLTYAELSGVPIKDIDYVLTLTMFIRALSGIRDSLRWMPADISLTAVRDMFERVRVSSWCIGKARQQMIYFTEALGPGWSVRHMSGLLNDLAHIAESYHAWATQREPTILRN